jgi:hypothetical protein
VFFNFIVCIGWLAFGLLPNRRVCGLLRTIMLFYRCTYKIIESASGGRLVLTSVLERNIQIEAYSILNVDYGGA